MWQALLLVLLGTSSTAPAAEGTAPITIKYPAVEWFDAAYIADEKGWFKQEGVQIEWVDAIPSAMVVRAVAAGTVDVASRPVPYILTAIAHGVNVQIIAAGARSTRDRPHMKFLVRPDSPIRSVADLDRKKIAINSMSMCAEMVLKEHLRRTLRNAEPTFVLLPDSKQSQALSESYVDASVVHSPYYEEPIATGAAREIFNDFVVDEGLSGMVPYFANGTLIAERPDAIRRFLRALVRASDWTNEHQEEAASIFARRRGRDPRYTSSGAYYEHGIVREAPIQWWVDLLVREGKLTPGQIDTASVFTNKYNPFSAGPAKR